MRSRACLASPHWPLIRCPSLHNVQSSSHFFPSNHSLPALKVNCLSLEKEGVCAPRLKGCGALLRFLATAAAESAAVPILVRNLAEA